MRLGGAMLVTPGVLEVAGIGSTWPASLRGRIDTRQVSL